MWQEQFDYFWDGRRRLAIGGFDGAERAPPLSARPGLTVYSCRDGDFQSGVALVDVIDAIRWRVGVVIADVAPEHRFVRLVAPDGGMLTLHLAGEREHPPGGDYRLLMTLLPEGANEGTAAFRVVSLSARGDVERLAREQTASAGARLVWAIGQRRLFEQPPGGGLLLRLTPARRIFPTYESRLVLEARPLETEAAADTREAPFAIMQHWLRENGAPRALLRLRIPDSIEESATLIGRTSVALAMNQRRRLRGWMQEQKLAGEPVIDPLTFEDIRQATGEAAEHPDAVDSTDAVVVANLLNLLLDPTCAEADGVTVRRGGDKTAPGLGETIEIDFYGAALGDEIGLVAPTARPGDLGVAPLDPGGPPFARMFRIEADGLTPRRVGDDDPLLEELMRRAATASARAGTGAAARAFAERSAGLKNRREKFAAALNETLARAGASTRFSAAGLWDLFEPMQQESFAALAGAAPALVQQIGGYGAYAIDPALTAALARGGPLARLAQGIDGRGAASLAARYAAACGAEGLTPTGLDPVGQLAALGALTQDEATLVLREARVGLSPEPETRRAAAIAAQRLADMGVVERTRAHFEKAHDAEAADELSAYLTLRRAGRWLPAEKAIRLAALIERAGVEHEEEQTRVAAGMTKAAAAPAPPVAAPAEKPKGFFRRLLGG
jgi:hypothetical protein